jgi:NADPH:quinone reductase
VRRVRYHEFGGPDVLRVEQAETPRPGPGQVLIRTEGIGANFVDTKTRQGPAPGSIFHRPLPGTLTGDVVGTVESAGPEVDASLVGRRVAALVAEDAVADHVVSDVDWLVPVPDGLDLGAASVLPMAAPLALRILRAGRLSAGETVLVHAAAGSIGHLTVQLAKLSGAGTVIGTASSKTKLDFVREQGADSTVDYSDPDWPDRVREAAPGGVDVVLDSVGGDVLSRSFDVLAQGGRIVAYGAAGGDLGVPPLTGFFALRTLTGFSLMAWRAADPEQARQDITEVTGYSAAGRLRTAVHARLPLTEAAEAHRILEQRSHLGRILLVP